MIKAILFDVYGTLISTGSGSVDAARRILEKNNSDIDPNEFYSHWKQLHKRNMRTGAFISEREIFGMDLRELYEYYRISGDYLSDVKIMLDSLYNRNAFDETKAVLEKLSGKYTLIIASNTDTEPLMQNFEYNNLQFDKVFTSELLKCYKPDKQFYRRILDEIACSADEAVFVGDSGEEDVVAPKKVGMTAVWVDRKNKGGNFGQDYTVGNLSELLDMF
ncbi:MAG: HAD family hydrolase [Oscillospiraceae bacterium]|nr:HAD family hydrolase [Oscillospiraceae bacterium]